MRRVTWLAAVLAGVIAAPVVPARPAMAAAVVTAYARADNPVAAAYRPTPAYSYNSSGGPVTVYRHGVGSYTVRFHGAATSAGVAHVAAYGSPAEVQCMVNGWGPSGTELLVYVMCAGDVRTGSTPADSRFVVSFTNAQYPGPGRLVHFRTDDAFPIGLRRIADAYDSLGGPVFYELVGDRYRIHLLAEPAALAAVVPMVHVTAHSSEYRHCQVSYTDALYVKCVGPDAPDPAFVRFTLTYGKRVDLLGRGGGRFGSVTLRRDAIVGGSIGGDGYVSTFPGGGGFSASALGPGSYVVTLRGLATAGGHALVGPVQDRGEDWPPWGVCNAVSWWPRGADEQVQVQCRDFRGGPRDINVRVSFTT
jgi:hypothetical protein